MKDVGQRIKQARLNAGLTQQQLAKRMKVTQGAIFQFEQSQDMQLSTLEKIAKALRISVAEMLWPLTPTHETKGA